MPLSYSTLEWGAGGRKCSLHCKCCLIMTYHRGLAIVIGCVFKDAYNKQIRRSENISVQCATTSGHKVRHARWHLHAMCNDSAGRYILFAPTRVDASSSKSSNKPAQPMLDDTCASVHVSMWIVFFHGEISHNASCTPQHEPTPNDGLLWTSPCR